MVLGFCPSFLLFWSRFSSVFFRHVSPLFLVVVGVGIGVGVVGVVVVVVVVVVVGVAYAVIVRIVFFILGPRTHNTTPVQTEQFFFAFTRSPHVSIYLSPHSYKLS